MPLIEMVYTVAGHALLSNMATANAKNFLQDQLEPTTDEEVIATAGMDTVAAVELVSA